MSLDYFAIFDTRTLFENYFQPPTPPCVHHLSNISRLTILTIGNLARVTVATIYPSQEKISLLLVQNKKDFMISSNESITLTYHKRFQFKTFQFKICDIKKKTLFTGKIQNSSTHYYFFNRFKITRPGNIGETKKS